ncbi:MAG: exosortase X [Bacteroidota bacterium]
MKTILSQPVYRFVILFSLLFVLWYVVYDLWLHPEGSIDQWIIDQTIILSTGLLESMGYVITTDGNREMAVEGSSGVRIGDNCNAITLIALFSGFVLAYPGRLKRKLWFIPAGILLIFFANVIRISVLAIFASWSRDWVEFNHTYTFTLLMYGLIFLMWLWWVEKLSGFQLLKKQ